MTKIPIEISELRKSVDGDTVKELADFLEEKLEEIEVDMTGSEIILSYEEEEKPFSRSYLRTLLRKFLHKAELKEFRVIAGKENAFVIKEKKLRIEE
ncbi:MAG: 60S ribosomal protein L22 [Candidatus Bathyarchaeota archaeon]|nr:60S ribosomal protein L22 [Candidatus Bathyarchaeota archaeon]